MTTPSLSLRRPRFSRAQPLPLRLTPDDLAILRRLGEYRFLRSTHLIQLLPKRSPKKLIERLGTLYHNGYVDRPRAQLDYFASAGSAPMVYAIGNHGAAVLAGSDGTLHANWNGKNRNVGKFFIEHALAIADLMVAAERAVRVHKDVKLIKPCESQSFAAPVKLTTDVVSAGRHHDITVVPDAVFGFAFPDATCKYFFVEADRATMPIVRADLAQSSFLRKLLAYLSGGGKHNAFGQQLGFDNFRVINVTTSTERLHSMLEALKHATSGKGSRQFLFTDQATLGACPDLFALEFTSGKGDRVRLLD